MNQSSCYRRFFLVYDLHYNNINKRPKLEATDIDILRVSQEITDLSVRQEREVRIHTLLNTLLFPI